MHKKKLKGEGGFRLHPEQGEQESRIFRAVTCMMRSVTLSNRIRPEVSCDSALYNQNFTKIKIINENTMEMSTQKKLKVAKMATEPIVAAVAAEQKSHNDDADDVKTDKIHASDTESDSCAPAVMAAEDAGDSDADASQASDAAAAAVDAVSACDEMVKVSEIEALVAQAEERGYLRGRNESIERLMHQPGILEREPWRRETSGQTDSEPMILNNLRVSIWDR